jgi:acyl carrier protein
MTGGNGLALASAIERITPIAQSLLKRRGLGKPLDADEPLRAAGLTSLDVVNLILAVEGEFDIFIPEDRITPDSLFSVTAIAALVTPLLAAA